ncbi:MAG TPA: isoprenylcysteine carboxylmethyltransferase family protein [Anaerolineales bacterium]|jgi:protein-S-isoprenylcysteine O-methyltransferase Ste14
MTTAFLRNFLAAYFLAFIGLAFFWRSYRVWRATGINPIKLGLSDSAHDYIGLCFAALLFASASMVALFAFEPAGYAYLLPAFWLASPALTWAGVTLLTIGLIWIVAAQAGMGPSWRIGVDADAHTDLIHHGLFAVSRNPIYLGMRVVLLGQLLALPNALSFAILLLGEVLVQIQARLEEEHLLKLHGSSYEAYRARTRRWI